MLHQVDYIWYINYIIIVRKVCVEYLWLILGTQLEARKSFPSIKSTVSRSHKCTLPQEMSTLIFFVAKYFPTFQIKISALRVINLAAKFSALNVIWILHQRLDFCVLRKKVKCDWAHRSKTLAIVQGCQIFLDTIYQNSGKSTKLPQHYRMTIHKIYQMAVKTFQMTIKHTNIFHSKTLQNLSQLRFWVWKYAHLATLRLKPTNSPIPISVTRNVLFQLKMRCSKENHFENYFCNL
jgi:hypothetical protein